MSVESAAQVRAGNSGRFAQLDVLRFIAAMAVVAYHFTYNFGDPRSSLTANSTLHGYLGVDLFFMISGFVMLWSARGRSAGAFVKARVLRLYPEFWLCVLLSAATFHFFREMLDRQIDLRMILLNLTMVPQYLGAEYVDGVYWTLGVEIKFYALLWVVLLARQMKNVEYLLYGWLSLAMLAVFVDNGLIRSLVLYPVGPLFTAGALFFLVYDSGWKFHRAAALLGCLVLGVLQAIERMPQFVSTSHVDERSQVATAALMFAFFATFAWLTRRTSTMKASPFIVWLGALTYPLYLLHNVGRAIFLTRPSGLPTWAALALALIFSLAISAAVYVVASRYVKPLLRTLMDVIGFRSPRVTPDTPASPA